MVATSGTGWVLAPCLERLIDETDRLFPTRSTASDGSVGDAAHSARTSDHNPSGGYVHAVDVTDDDAHGCDVGLLAAHLVASKDPRVKYLIHKSTIWKARNGFAPEVYTGTNAHEHHLHVSVLDGQENALGAWWPQSKPKPPAAPPVAAPEDAMLITRQDQEQNSQADCLLFVGGKLFKAHAGAAKGNAACPKVSVTPDIWGDVIKTFGPVID